MNFDSTWVVADIIADAEGLFLIVKLDGRFFFSGPLNNLKESMIQFSKPRKLVNRTNPVR